MVSAVSNQGLALIRPPLKLGRSHTCRSHNELKHTAWRFEEFTQLVICLVSCISLCAWLTSVAPNEPCVMRGSYGTGSLCSVLGLNWCGSVSPKGLGCMSMRMAVHPKCRPWHPHSSEYSCYPLATYAGFFNSVSWALE